MILFGFLTSFGMTQSIVGGGRGKRRLASILKVNIVAKKI
jgi:hypothetical protein